MDNITESNRFVSDPPSFAKYDFEVKEGLIPDRMDANFSVHLNMAGRSLFRTDLQIFLSIIKTWLIQMGHHLRELLCLTISYSSCTGEFFLNWIYSNADFFLNMCASLMSSYMDVMSNFYSTLQEVK